MLFNKIKYSLKKSVHRFPPSKKAVTFPMHGKSNSFIPNLI
jgi:hypothetical protein